MMASPLGCAATASPKTRDRLKPLSAITHTNMIAAPLTSSTALIICTQVVPFIPPTST